METVTTHLPAETTLVNQARAGNRHAFGSLVSQHYRTVYRLTRRIAGNAEDAEDILQNAALKAYSRLDQFQGQARFSTWFAQIAINEALMHLRQRKLERSIPFGETSSTYKWSATFRELRDSRQDPERHYAALELHQILSQALNGLSPRLSTVFVLRNVEGFSPPEIAHMLGLSMASVKARLFRARLQLQRKVGRLMRDPSRARLGNGRNCLQSSTTRLRRGERAR